METWPQMSVGTVALRSVGPVILHFQASDVTFNAPFAAVPTPSGTAVAQCLRCCATNRKVSGSMPDGVTGIFH